MVGAFLALFKGSCNIFNLYYHLQVTDIFQFQIAIGLIGWHTVKLGTIHINLQATLWYFAIETVFHGVVYSDQF